MFPTFSVRRALVALGAVTALGGCGQESSSGSPSSSGGQSGSPSSSGGRIGTGGRSTQSTGGRAGAAEATGGQTTGGQAAGGQTGGTPGEQATGGQGSGGSTPACGGTSGETSGVEWFWMESSAPIGGGLGIYAGGAIVERSMNTELVLASESSEASDATAPPYRFRLSGVELPIFPPGALVYLTKDPAGNPEPVPPYRKRAGQAWSIRDREAGTLLMGSSIDLPMSVAAPVAARVGTDTCSRRNPYCAVEDAEFIVQSVEVLADSTVVFDSRETRTVAIDGKNYRVQAQAHRATAGSDRASCRVDYFPDTDTGLEVDAFAEDLESRIEDLERVALPDCSHGNDPPAEVGFALYEVSVGTTYEGPVFFRSVEPSYSRSFLFDVPELVSSGPAPTALGVSAPPETFDAPTAGTEYWAEYSHDVATLRDAQRGPLVLASAYNVQVPFSESSASKLSGALGIGVAAERRCDYASASETIALWDLVFDTDPPTRIRSGEVGDLTYDGEEYSVWLWGEGAVDFSVFRR